jgi:hypothetical protein
MKSRIIWGAVLLAAFAAFYFVTIRPAMIPAPRRYSGPATDRMPLVTHPPKTFTLPPEFMTATLPIPVMPTPPMPMIRVDPPKLKLEVPIHNGATIDFSYGGPVVKSGGEDQAALDRALKEMAEATKDTKFAPKQ